MVMMPSSSWKGASATFAQTHTVNAPAMATFIATTAATMAGHYRNIRQDSAMDGTEQASTNPMMMGR